MHVVLVRSSKSTGHVVAKGLLLRLLAQTRKLCVRYVGQREDDFPKAEAASPNAK